MDCIDNNEYIEDLVCEFALLIVNDDISAIFPENLSDEKIDLLIKCASSYFDERKFKMKHFPAVFVVAAIISFQNDPIPDYLGLSKPAFKYYLFNYFSHLMIEKHSRENEYQIDRPDFDTVLNVPQDILIVVENQCWLQIYRSFSSWLTYDCPKNAML